MSSATTTSSLDLPFLDGAPKQLLIGGEWVEGHPAATMPSINPSTGEVLADIADADAEDVTPGWRPRGGRSRGRGAP